MQHVEGFLLKVILAISVNMGQRQTLTIKIVNFVTRNLPHTLGHSNLLAVVVLPVTNANQDLAQGHILMRKGTLL